MAGDSFGVSVAVDGGTILVGAYQVETGDLTDVGAAYVFRWDGVQWVEEARLMASDPQAFAYFGHSVALSGKTALVGAVFADIGSKEDASSVYVFRWEP